MNDVATVVAAIERVIGESGLAPCLVEAESDLNSWYFTIDHPLAADIGISYRRMHGDHLLCLFAYGHRVGEGYDRKVEDEEFEPTPEDLERRVAAFLGRWTAPLSAEELIVGVIGDSLREARIVCRGPFRQESGAYRWEFRESRRRPGLRFCLEFSGSALATRRLYGWEAGETCRTWDLADPSSDPSSIAAELIREHRLDT